MITWIYAVAAYLFIGAVLERVVDNDDVPHIIFIILWPFGLSIAVGIKVGIVISDWIHKHWG